MRVGVKVDGASFNRIVARAEKMPQRTYRTLRRELDRWGESWHRGVSDRISSGTTGANSLHNRSGQLRRSLNYTVEGTDLSSLKMRAFSAGALHATVHEFGGVIRARNARFLTIPTEANKSASGKVRFPSAREFIAAHPKETYFIRVSGPRDALLLMWKNPAKRFRASARKAGLGGRTKGDDIVMFRLVSSVKIPGPNTGAPSRLGFFDEWNDRKRERAAGLQRIAREAVGAGS